MAIFKKFNKTEKRDIYYIDYYDENGKRQRECTGSGSHYFAKEYLNKKLDEVAHRKKLPDRYIPQVKFSDFENDRKTQSSVIMQLQVIGELVKKIPEDIKSSINLPWKKMAGMRDMVAHDYFSLDLEAVWNTVTKDIPELAKDINKYLMNA